MLIFFTELCSFIKENVIDKKQCYLLDTLCTLYTENLKNKFAAGSQSSSDLFSTKHLEQKISDT